MTPRTTPPPLPNTMPPRLATAGAPPPQQLATRAAPAMRTAPGPELATTPAVRPPRRRSILLRAVIGLALLLGLAVGAAALMHASIDPREEALTAPIADQG